MSTWHNLNTQNSSSPFMEQTIFLHDYILLILLMIMIFISYLMSKLFLNKFINQILLKKQTIEFIWTILPAIILMFIALPSIHLLYILDEMNNPLISIKSIGHQWYWSYEYSDFKKMEFNSYLKKQNTLINNFRLLDVDNRIVLPYKSQIRMMVSSTDVIHSWTIPSLGVKIDAIPGRLNQIKLLMNKTGLMFGQCSEICGLNHSFMPISIESVSPNSFIKWIMKN